MNTASGYEGLRSDLERKEAEIRALRSELQEIRTRALDLEDTRRAMLYMLEDLNESASELKKRAAELREAQRVAGLGSWELEWGTGTVTWSEEIYRIFGRDPASPAPTYKEHANILTSQSMAQFDSAIRKTLQTGDPFEVDLELIRPDGTTGWITARGEIKQNSGDSILLRGTALDVTQRRRLEDQLRQAQKMEAVGQLAGGIAHDFNNILTAIMGYGNLLLMKQRADDPLRTYVEQVLAAADRAASLTHSLLAFSRKQVISMRPVSINEIVRKVEGFLRRIIGEDISLRTTLSGDDITAMADRGQMEQVLMNLATNARDAMPQGGILSIETGQATIDRDFIREHGYGKTGNYAVITVKDTGSGMDEATLRKIFEPFFTTKPAGKGTGLGLAITYGIIKQHNGYIDVSSEPGAGTTFRIFLRATAAPDEDMKGQPAVSAETGGTETILVAEDDAALRTLTREVLSEFGYSVITAGNGDEAVAAFLEKRDSVRLCLLDLVMPGRSGTEVYDAIKAARPDIKILFMSGYTADGIVRGGMTREGVDCLLKPISPRDLLMKVREVLDKQ